jgi:hypothetical protein
MERGSRADARTEGEVRRDPRARVGGVTARLGLALAIASTGLFLSEPVAAQQDTLPPDSVAAERSDTLRFELEA